MTKLTKLIIMLMKKVRAMGNTVMILVAFRMDEIKRRRRIVVPGIM